MNLNKVTSKQGCEISAIYTEIRVFKISFKPDFRAFY